MSKTLGGCCHFYNEELLLPGFVKHHVNLFDEMIMVNHNSTDASVEIIKDIAPHWKIVDTALPDFEARANDDEIVSWEKTLATDYKQIINVTEWIWKPNYKQYIEESFANNPTVDAIGMKQILLIDDEESKPILDPLWINRTTGFVDEAAHHRRWRFIHKKEHGHYGLGRHNTELSTYFDHDLFLLYWHLSPFPECLPRKLQIQTRIPWENKVSQLGFQHITDAQKLSQMRLDLEKNNLLEDIRFSETYWFLTNGGVIR